jgi:natural product biosynthesis luciferase-like monooxygenase protein
MNRSLGPIPNLVELLRYRAIAKPDFEAYTWLSDDEQARSLSYAELDLKARSIATQLKSAGVAKEPVVLAYPAGLEFIAGFFGCLYAGAIAVPVYPPGARRGMDRLVAIIGDCKAQVGLTTPALAKRLNKDGGIRQVQWLTADINRETSVEWELPQLFPETLALLQYTSGSTGNPKGVMVSHGNIMANERAIQQSFRQDESSVVVSWLPMAHDMGLIGGVLQPLYAGARSVLFSPATFVPNPARWLRTISRYRATTSGGPDFAYRLCSRKLDPGIKAELDLSCWRVAFNGAEPVRRETLDEFSQNFKDCGFSPKAFHPCYGLAESTLLVACTNGEPAQKMLASQFTSCGPVIEEHIVQIVDPKSGLPCGNGVTGEIWVSGPSVAQGYWGRAKESDSVFRARFTSGDDRLFLRTGDLGFIQSGELVIAGRLKDVIIIRGQNYYAEDLEMSIEQSHPDLQPNSTVVFAIEGAANQRIVAVQEVSRKLPSFDSIIATIRQTVSIEHEVHLDEVALVQEGTIPRTSSGKVRRGRCRQLLEKGEIEVLARWRSRSSEENGGTQITQLTDFDDVEAVCEWIKINIAELTGSIPQSIDFDREIASYGIDSLMAAEFVGRLAEYRIELDVAALFQRTIRSLAAMIASSPKKQRIMRGSVSSVGEFPLSRGQNALWLNQQFDASSPIYNLAVAVRTQSPFVPARMQSACEAVVARHAILGVTVPVIDGQPFQRISEPAPSVFEYIDTTGLEPVEVERHLAMTAYQPFDLATGPLVRVILYQGGPSSPFLLVVAHHIVSDFSSLALLMQELLAWYASGPENLQVSAAPFTEFIRQEEQILKSDAEHRLWEFWREELTPLPPYLELPVKHSAEPAATGQAGWQWAHVDPATLAALRRLSAERHTTLYTTLVAAFQVLLHRYSGQSDFAIGSPISLRDSEFQHTQGYFINPIILRARFGEDVRFLEFLDQTRHLVLRALEHRHFPFGMLVTRLQPVRTPGRPPLVEALFTFLSGSRPIADTAVFGLGVPGAKLTIANREVESMALRPAFTEFNLTFMVAEATDGLHAALGYNQGLYTAETARKLLCSWKQLLEGIAANPSERISQLPVFSAKELQFALSDFKDTSTDFENICIHQAFERKALEMRSVIAVIGEGKSLTYSDLNERANRLACHLHALGVRPDNAVGVCVRRSPDLLVALLGILKSGGAYLPLDPNYPADRIEFMLSNSGAKVVVAHEALTAVLQGYHGKIIHIDREWPEMNASPACKVDSLCQPNNLAYVIYTSGSTGKPKGVMLTHRNVTSFFAAMDRVIDAKKGDAWLALTSVCFDISVLELLWTITRGIQVLLDSGRGVATATNLRKIGFSLFYFASNAADVPDTRYQLLLEGAKFADEHGFEAIWTPERHFHTFGGTYPNPSLIGAALAVITNRIQIRAGSVVLPLHHPVRVAEDWSVVDNLSKGRVGVSFASGWHADDFVLAPASYNARREIMFREIDTVRKLWRGERVQFQSGTGNQVEVGIHPAPRQPELPVWVTAAGSEETFQMAGKIGANLLTHLLGQSIQDVAHNIRLYRAAWREAGYSGTGKVTLMLHTFVGEDTDRVREIVREPMIAYLKDSVSLIKNFARSTGQEMPDDFDSTEMKALLAAAFERYFETSGLFGTPERCLKILEQLKDAQVDEVACLIDFGVDLPSVLKGLHLLAEVKRETEAPLAGFECRPTHLQCTPSLARMLLDRQDILSGLHCMLVGGEALPVGDAKRLTRNSSGKVYNMYGPTETCIWSTSDLLNGEDDIVNLGSPLTNTRLYVTGIYNELVPPGVPGEICIGGEGVARGYLGHPDLTAARFAPDPFSNLPGARMFRTGDRGVLSPERRLQFLGRLDNQVKLRGHRIELGEIEDVLSHHPAVREAAAMVQSSPESDSQLFCYMVPRQGDRPSADELRGFLSKKLPEYMLPSGFIWLQEMPRTPNGKLDRKMLVPADGTRACNDQSLKQPEDIIEEVLAGIWAKLLDTDSVGVNRSFFDVGGHSLLALQLLGLVREIFHVRVDLGAFFKNPTITGLAHSIRVLAGDRAQLSAELFRKVEQLPEGQVEEMLTELEQTQSLPQ